MEYTGSTSTTDYEGDTIPTSELEDGQQWTCLVIANDGINPSLTATALTTIEVDTSSYTLHMENEEIDFVRVEMGEDPLERYVLEHDVYVQNAEVTQALYYKVFHSSPSSFRDCGWDCPVERISWNQAARFAMELSERQGLDSCYECSYSNELIL